MYATSVLGLRVQVVLWLFLLYSCAGVLVEGVFCLVLSGRPELRLGLLYLPLRPVYGLGGVGCTLLLTPLLHRPLLVFGLSVVVCSVVEYAAGWTIEKAFRTTSWDYSDKRLNLHGRICLQYSLCWGMLATAALYAFHWFGGGAALRPATGLSQTVLTVLVVLTLLSVVLTLAALARVRRRLDGLSAGAEDRAADTGWDRLVDRLVPDLVLIHSFPRMGLSAELREVTDRRRRRPVSTSVAARSSG